MFLALLELIKLNRVHVAQDNAYDEIYLDARMPGQGEEREQGTGNREQANGNR